MRLAVIVLILLFIVFGALFGALNAERIPIDLYFAQPSLPKGALLLAAVAFGWLLGGLVAWFARVPRLRRDLRNAERRLRQIEAQPAAKDAGASNDE